MKYFSAPKKALVIINKKILYVTKYIVYMAFADNKTANKKCLDSKFSDSKYLDSKQKIKITYFWEKWEIFKDKILSFQ